MDTCRILHFSDVHLGLRDFHFGYLFDKRFFGRLNQFVTRQRRLSLENLEVIAAVIREQHIDQVVCTGDLSSIGSAEEFAYARQMLAPIIDACNGHFLYVPGNHDAYIKANHQALEEVFRQLNGGALALGDLPAVLEFGHLQFILLNPARPCLIWQSTGELTPDAWGELDKILSLPRQNGKKRILLSHFPLVDHRGKTLSWRAKLLSAERLERHLQENHVDLFLTGHVHKPFVFGGTDGTPLQVGAGSLTIHDSYAIVEIPENGPPQAKICRIRN